MDLKIMPGFTSINSQLPGLLSIEFLFFGYCFSADTVGDARRCDPGSYEWSRQKQYDGIIYPNQYKAEQTPRNIHPHFLPVLPEGTVRFPLYLGGRGPFQ